MSSSRMPISSTNTSTVSGVENWLASSTSPSSMKRSMSPSITRYTFGSNDSMPRFDSHGPASRR